MPKVVRIHRPQDPRSIEGIQRALSLFFVFYQTRDGVETNLAAAIGEDSTAGAVLALAGPVDLVNVLAGLLRSDATLDADETLGG